MNILHVFLLLVSLITACHGACPLVNVTTFLQNSSVAITMSLNGAYNLPTDNASGGTVLSGAFVPMQCNNGYKLASGQLNITCIGDSWTPLPNCVLNSATQCSVDPASSAFAITNGYIATATVTSATAASVQYACITGYTIDPSIGASYVCNNGQWSTKPQCKISVNLCPYAQLDNFTKTAGGLQTTGQSSLMVPQDNKTVVLNGSYIVFSCMSGYVNTGGNLNVTCLSNGSWSQFPNCVSTSGPSCSFDPATLLVIANGYPASTSLSYTSNTTATGSIQFACITGYTLNPSIGASYVCNNGQWSTKPQCTQNAVSTVGCPYEKLRIFLSTATAIQTAGPNSLVPSTGQSDYLATGSYIVFSCITGYVNIGGSLNVTCLSNSSWSYFPSCTLNSATQCSVDPSSPAFSIANGYIATASVTSATTASVQYACATGYTLNPSIGGAYTCNNGQWSTKPQCIKSTNLCSYAQLDNSTKTAGGLQTTGQSSLMTPQDDRTSILNGSYIVFSCMSGYVNTGGNLNVTCLSNGSWSYFPNCTLNSATQCSVDPSSSTFAITNGYIATASVTSATTASVQYACATGYTLNPSIGGAYTCNNGQWSTKPQCIKSTNLCSYAQLDNSTKTAGGLQTTGQSSLMTPQDDKTSILNGSYIVFSCMSGYVNTGGNLNVTCLSNGSWSYFPNCTSNSATQCSVDPSSSAFAITNGYIATASVTSATTASVQYACITGYTLNPSIGASYTCNNGQWSTKPQCVQNAVSTLGCPYEKLRIFLSTATAIQTAGPNSLIPSTAQPDYLATGSYIVFSCVTGYVNIGGSLNVTCLSNSSWSYFPSCTLNSATQCSVDPSSPAFAITNGYIATASVTSATTASVQYACLTGYTLNPSIGGAYTCNNGQWSTKPQCLKSTNLCPYAQLDNYTKTAGGLQTTGPSSLMTPQDDKTSILNGSYIVFSCASGYVNIGGNLNVTCLSNGSWSYFPNCTLNSATQCSVDPSSSAFAIPNGYIATASVTSATTASVQYACLTGYTLNPSIGASYVCNNGQWSTKPQCVQNAVSTLGCPYEKLRAFLTTATAMQTAGPNSLIPSTAQPDYLATGSYIVFSCITGYVNIGGSLNVTCLSNSSWSYFPSCTLNSATQCSVDPSSSAFAITNGYIATASVTSATTASVQYACATGYTLNPSIGGAYTCNNGQWSTKPQCVKSTNLCPYAQLDNYTKTAGGLQATGQSSLMTPQDDRTSILNGSYIVFSCMSGYVNIGGNLNVTCLSNGSWSYFPNCTLNSATQCSVDPSSSAFAITNGYIATASVTSATAASVQYACMTGYTLNPSIGASYVCNNGQWSTKPQCIQNAVSTLGCPYEKLRTFLTTATAIQTAGPNSLIPSTGQSDYLATGSYIVFSCITGYVNIGGSLNVTCLSNSSWSYFPSCTLNSATQCSVDPSSSAFTIANGYIATASVTSATTASVQYACMTGYTLNPSIGASYVCNNGQWSTKPQCIQNGATVACSYAQLDNYTKTATGTQTTGQSSLIRAQGSTDSIAIGSYIVFSCVTGYANVGGSLNVTCSSSGSWGDFPKCVSTCANVPYVAYGQVANATSVQYSSNKYERKVLFKCMTGYTQANTLVQPWVSCTNGVWDTLPICGVSASCNGTELQQMITVGMRVTTSSLIAGGKTNLGILVNSWINFYCSDPYKWVQTSGPLNVTCQSTGKWTATPKCSL